MIDRLGTAGRARPVTSGAAAARRFQVGDRGVDHDSTVETRGRSSRGERASLVLSGRHLAQPAQRQSAEEVGQLPRRVPGRTSSRNRDGDSENSRTTSRRRVVVARNIARARSSAPRPPARAISASATASPPSLRSWQLRTSPRLIAAWTARNMRGPGRGIDPRALARPRAARAHAQCEPPSSAGSCPTSSSTIPRLLQIHRHARRTSGTWPIALIRSVGGIARLWPSCVYSLLRLSLPEMNGVP